MKSTREQSELMKSVDRELAKLRRIVDLIEQMNYGEKERTIHYLASRYERFLEDEE